MILPGTPSIGEDLLLEVAEDVAGCWALLADDTLLRKLVRRSPVPPFFHMAPLPAFSL